jgi:hypothetical protein
MSFKIRFQFTVNMVMAPCNSMPTKPYEDATSHPCLAIHHKQITSIELGGFGVIIHHFNMIKLVTKTAPEVF